MTLEALHNIISGVLTQQAPKIYPTRICKTSFVDPEIPQDAGALFIILPSKDALSDEVLDNIQEWLAYGDRNLIIVGDDPIFEADGFYEETNRIVNTLLEKLSLE